MKAASAAALAAALAAAPSPCLGSGYEFEGLGARQVSRAGAAVADAEDWTSGYWNPANTVRAAQKTGLEIGLEAFGGLAYARDSNSLSALPGVGAIFSKDRLSSPYVLGGLGALAPLGKRAAVGAAVYTPLLQGTDFSDNSSGGTALDYHSRAGILVSNFSASFDVLATLAAGAGLNLVYGQISVNSTAISPPGLPGVALHNELSGSGMALEGIFGLRYDPHPKLSLGLVYRTGADVRIRGEAVGQSNAGFLPAESSRFRYTLRQPPTSDVGLAWRPTPSWTLTTDLHHTYWHRFTSEIRYDRPGTLLADSPNTFYWRDAWKLRFGSRYKLGTRAELLAGYSRDRSATNASATDFSTAVDVPLDRVSGGLSWRWSKTLETTLGAIGAYGTRSEKDALYRLSGFQLMAEARLNF